MRPIPLNLLPLDAEVYEPDDKSEFGGAFCATAKKLTHVRYDSNTALLRTDYVLSDGSRGLVYIDSENTGGAYEVPVGSKLTIGSEDFIVEKVSRYEDFNGHVHHWEVEVR